jgi:hypothetical protein
MIGDVGCDAASAAFQASMRWVAAKEDRDPDQSANEHPPLPRAAQHMSAPGALSPGYGSLWGGGCCAGPSRTIQMNRHEGHRFHASPNFKNCRSDRHADKRPGPRWITNVSQARIWCPVWQCGHHSESLNCPSRLIMSADASRLVSTACLVEGQLYISIQWLRALNIYGQFARLITFCQFATVQTVNCEDNGDVAARIMRVSCRTARGATSTDGQSGPTLVRLLSAIEQTRPTSHGHLKRPQRVDGSSLVGRYRGSQRSSSPREQPNDNTHHHATSDRP